MKFSEYGEGLSKARKLSTMTRDDAIRYVAYVVDDAGSGRSIGSDQHAIVRERSPNGRSIDPPSGFDYGSVLIGWQCGFEPLFVAVHSYLDVRLDDGEAEEMAKEYLDEIGWFADGPIGADYIIR